MRNPKSFNRILAFLVVLYSTSFSHAQSLNTGHDEFETYSSALEFHDQKLNRKADSTLNRLQLDKFVKNTSSISLDILLLKAKLKFHFFQTDSSIYYYRHAIKKAELLGNTEIISSLYNKIASPFMRNRESDSAFYFMNLSIELDSVNGNNKNYQAGLRKKADMYWAIGHTDKALTILDRCYDIAVKEENFSNMQKVRMNIGRIYMNVGEFELAETYMLQSQEIGKQNNLGVETIINFRKTILYTFWEKWEMADSVNQLAIAEADSSETPVFYSNLLLQAGRIAMNTGKYDLAERYGNRAKVIREINRTNDGMAKSYLFKARLLTFKEEYEEANFWMDSALFYGEEIFDPLVRVRMYHQKALIATYLDNDEERNAYITKYNSVNDSIGGVQNVKAVSDREMQLAVEKVNQEKDLLALELDKQKSKSSKTLWMILGGVGVVLLILAFVFYRNRQKNVVKEQQLQDEKQEIEKELANKEKQIENYKETGQVLEELPDHFEPLSKREKDVFELLVQGLSDKEIAEKLFVSLPTVRTHTRHIYEKFHINSRMEAKDISLKYKVL